MSPTAATEICGIPFDDIGFDATVESILNWAVEGSGGYVCTPNVDYIVRSARDSAFREALIRARLRVPDGMGVVYGSRLAGSPLRESVTGRYLPKAVCEGAARLDLSVGLFGGGPGVAERAAAALVASTGVRIELAFGPSLGFQLGSEEDDAAARRLSPRRVRILFVALGAPKQELWMLRHQSDLDGCIQVGVGQAFDVLAGRTRAAPAWATRIGAEWVFRLAQDPTRLGPRYLADDPRFFWWMLKKRLARVRLP